MKILQIDQDAYLLKKIIEEEEQNTILQDLKDIQIQSPFRRMTTSSGYKMSVEMTNCGEFGWLSDEKGYRYTKIDPITKQPWPKMPDIFFNLAQKFAKLCNFKEFNPNVCLINHYKTNTKLGLHQDRDEKDFTKPIVSFSFGADADFLWGGKKRTDPTKLYTLTKRDVLIWGGQTRLNFHGISKIYQTPENTTRLNLTFREIPKSIIFQN